MAYIGVSSALTQAFGISYSARIKKKNNRMIVGCLLLIFGFFYEVYSNNLWLSLLSIGIIIFGAGILTTTITASFSQLLPKGFIFPLSLPSILFFSNFKTFKVKLVEVLECLMQLRMQ